jgi:uncharacterized membrane protein (DUF4010 family)
MIAVPELLAVPEVLKEIVIALAIGGLIGIERENEPDRKYAGLRTLSLLCGVGPAVVAVSQRQGTFLFSLLYLVLAASLALTIAFVRFRIEGEDIGFTTSVAVFVVAVMGVLAGYNMYFAATSMALITAFLLANKENLNRRVNKLSNAEISDAVKVGALMFILLPILPTEPVGPYDAIVLREVVLLAIFVLLIEFVAFISMRQIGMEKGLPVTGLLGGGASSFATAGVMARIAEKTPDLKRTASAGLILSILAMIVRNVAIAATVEVSLLDMLLVPAVVMVGLAGMFAYLLWEQKQPEDVEIPMDSPFSFKAAATFSAAFIVISLISAFAVESVGSTGLYLTAFAGSLVSSTAVVTSAASLISSGTVEPFAGGAMVLVAIFGSICSKLVLVESINRGEMRKTVILPLIVVGLAGIGVFFLL